MEASEGEDKTQNVNNGSVLQWMACEPTMVCVSFIHSHITHNCVCKKRNDLEVWERCGNTVSLQSSRMKCDKYWTRAKSAFCVWLNGWLCVCVLHTQNKNPKCFNMKNNFLWMGNVETRERERKREREWTSHGKNVCQFNQDPIMFAFLLNINAIEWMDGYICVTEIGCLILSVRLAWLWNNEFPFWNWKFDL